MRFIYVLVVFFAVLRSVSPATAVFLEEAGTTFVWWDNKQAFQVLIPKAGQGTAANKPNTSVVKVNGGVRQTITAVHPGPSPKQSEKSEMWWMTFLGLVLLLISVLSFFSPETFMYGRRSGFWRGLIGEKATAIMIRVISFIVGVAGILIMIGGIFTIFDC